jgi:hypothetical protein
MVGGWPPANVLLNGALNREVIMKKTRTISVSKEKIWNIISKRATDELNSRPINDVIVIMYVLGVEHGMALAEKEFKKPEVGNGRDKKNV